MKQFENLKMRKGGVGLWGNEMKRFLKILLLLVCLSGFIAFWYWADEQDYFQSEYDDLPISEEAFFTWHAGDSDEGLKR